MKKLVLIIVLFALTSLTAATIAQEKHKTFCQIVGTGKVFSPKVKIEIDFGYKRSYWNQYKKFMVDKTGKKIEFYSMVDAMNYLANWGWKFEQAYTAVMGGRTVYHWLLSKDIVSDDEIREGIITQKDFEDMEKEALKALENNTPNNDSILDAEETIRKRYE